jgi:hypothetical protein
MIQTSDKVNAAGKSVRQMDDEEVRARLYRIAAYNRYHANTHHVVTEGDIYGYMTEEWHVDPAVYGIRMSAPVPWKASKKLRQKVAWLPENKKEASDAL